MLGANQGKHAVLKWCIACLYVVGLVSEVDEPDVEPLPKALTPFGGCWWRGDGNDEVDDNLVDQFSDQRRPPPPPRRSASLISRLARLVTSITGFEPHEPLASLSGALPLSYQGGFVCLSNDSCTHSLLL